MNTGIRSITIIKRIDMLVELFANSKSICNMRIKNYGKNLSNSLNSFLMIIKRR